MTLRHAMASVFGMASLVAAASCATAGPPAEGPFRLVDRASDYELQVLVDGAPAPTFAHGGGTYVLGQLGERYTLRVINHSGRRIEAVVSVDGRDVIDGRPADFRGKRGYLVPAWGQIDIDGWRLSAAQAAAFRFSTVAASYAARTGSAREVGVIGAAIFPERYVPRPIPLPRPLELRRGPAASEDMPRKRGAERDAEPAPASPPALEGLAEEDSSASSSRGHGSASQPRPGLGTEFGEAVSSPVFEVAFVRANASRPAAVLGARYNDHDGLLALGIDVDGLRCTPWNCDRETALRQSALPFPTTDRRRFAAPPPCWREEGCAR